MTADSTPAPSGDAPGPVKRRGITTWLKWGGIAIVVLALAALVGGYTLPREPAVTRSVGIARPRAEVFPLVGDLRHLADWSPWLAGDPDVAITFTGPLDGVGQAVSWESKLPAVGSGAETITAVSPDEAVQMQVRRSGKPDSEAWFTLTNKGAGETTVVWGYRRDLGFNPIERYRGLGIDGEVGPDYERGLARLKAFAETLPNADQPGTAQSGAN